MIVKADWLDKFLCLLLPLLALLPFVSMIYPGYRPNSWQITEWLINYEGGFVRRGLPGQVLLQLSEVGIHPYFAILGMSIGLWIVLILLFLRWSLRRGFPLLIVCSQLCLLGPVIGHQIVRKDCLLILCFVSALFFTRKSGLVSALVANSFSAVAVLSHEVYGVIAIPIFLLVKYVEQHAFASKKSASGSMANASRLYRLIRAVTFNSPLVALFVICLTYHGNPQTAHNIWNSWQSQITSFPWATGMNLRDPKAAVGAIAWSTADGFRRGGFSVLDDFSFGIYVPFAWLVTAALTVFYVLLIYRSHLETLKMEESRAKEEILSLAGLLSLQFLAILPVCLVFWDFGRLIFIATASAIGAFLILEPERQLAVRVIISDAISVMPQAVRCAIHSVRWAYSQAVAAALSSSRRLAIAKFSLLFLGIPVCCWSIVQAVSYAPIVQPFYYVITAIENGGWRIPPRIASRYVDDPASADLVFTCSWRVSRRGVLSSYQVEDVVLESQALAVTHILLEPEPMQFRIPRPWP